MVLVSSIAFRFILDDGFMVIMLYDSEVSELGTKLRLCEIGFFYFSIFTAPATSYFRHLIS